MAQITMLQTAVFRVLNKKFKFNQSLEIFVQSKQLDPHFQTRIIYIFREKFKYFGLKSETNTGFSGIFGHAKEGQKKDKRRTFYEKEGHFRNVMEDACYCQIWFWDFIEWYTILHINKTHLK